MEKQELRQCVTDILDGLRKVKLPSDFRQRALELVDLRKEWPEDWWTVGFDEHTCELSLAYCECAEDSDDAHFIEFTVCTRFTRLRTWLEKNNKEIACSRVSHVDKDNIEELLASAFSFVKKTLPTRIRKSTYNWALATFHIGQFLRVCGYAYVKVNNIVWGEDGELLVFTESLHSWKAGKLDTTAAFYTLGIKDGNINYQVERPLPDGTAEDLRESLNKVVHSTVNAGIDL